MQIVNRIARNTRVPVTHQQLKHNADLTRPRVCFHLFLAFCSFVSLSFRVAGVTMVTLFFPPQGKVHLELRLSEVITDSGVVCHKLATR